MLALIWHLYFGLLAVALILGQRPSKRLGGILLGLPLLSVSALAWMSANPFNGAVFAVVGVILIAVAAKLPDEPVRIAPTWALSAGVLMFLFGWLYPHFLDTSSFLPYLYAAPTGLVPCPTLSILIGLSLMVGGFDSRSWSLVLSATGIFYGLFGAVRLGVTIDWVLLLGALLLILVNLVIKTAIQKHALAH
ncbi:MAG: hypothetical protein IT328_13380 [Caldilineaceae bacterium]|nr:hypothetical protein [Caldilineaceae bacterium]